MKPFLGLKIGATSRARFLVELGDLPLSGLVRSSLVETTSAGIKVRQIGATVKIEGFPNQEISWQLVSQKNGLEAAAVELESYKNIDISPSLSEELFKLNEDAFRRVVLSG